MPAQPAAPGRAPGTVEPKPDRDARPGGEARLGRGGTPFPPSVPSGPSSAMDPDRPTRPRADAPTGPATPPGAPAGNSGPTSTSSAPAESLRDGSGGSGGNTSNQSAAAPTPSATAPPQNPPVVLDSLDGSAPPAPRTHQTGTEQPSTDTDGCSKKTGEYRGYYECTIARTAPLYRPEKRKPLTTQGAGRQITFLCQSAGSRYSVGNRVNHWWAWLWVPYLEFGVWVPVVFLEGGPDNGPEPGLPVCDRESPATTTEPSPASAGGAPSSTTEQHPATTSAPPAS
jgi:hypothetical protein